MKSIFTIFLLFIFTNSLVAQIPGWMHKQSILVTENSGNQVIDYQLLINFDTQSEVSNGNMLADGSDIRFSSDCDGGTIFPYWIESGMNTANTKIWIKIDTLNASSSRTVYMHFGNNAASQMSAIQGTFVGPHSATDSVSSGSGGGVTDSQRGFRFSPNENILLTAVGKYEPNASTRYITLFDFATQAIIFQTQVSGPAAQYSYQNTAAPLWLTQGTQYILEMYQGASDGYYYGAAPQIGQHLSYLDMRYCNGCDQNTFPTNYLNGIHYGYSDFWYFTRNNVNPAPSYTYDAYVSNMADSIYVCSGESSTLNTALAGGTEPFQYTWTNYLINDNTLASPTVSNLTDYTYHVLITDACGNQLTDSLFVEVKSLPQSIITANPSEICQGFSSTLSASGAYAFSWSDASTNDSLIVLPTADSTFNVTVTDLFGCSTTSSATVIVNNPVSVSNTIDLCYGETYQIGTNTYNQNGIYVDTLMNVHNCDSIVTTNLTIKTDIDAQIQQLGFLLIANIGADGYQWIDCLTGLPLVGATSSSYTFTADGTYACIFTVDNCTKESNCIAVQGVGVDELVEQDSFKYYPNPVNNSLTIVTSTDETLQIADLNGKIIFEETLQANKIHHISTSSFESGMYFLNHGNQVARVIVQH